MSLPNLTMAVAGLKALEQTPVRKLENTPSPLLTKIAECQFHGHSEREKVLLNR
jgi:hypothetical protein